MNILHVGTKTKKSFWDEPFIKKREKMKNEKTILTKQNDKGNGRINKMIWNENNETRNRKKHYQKNILDYRTWINWDKKKH